MKLSEWQEGSSFPQEEGIYQRQLRTESGIGNSVILYSYFDGLAWYYGTNTKQGAYDNKNLSNIGCYQTDLHWRGVIEE